ncbi:MAG: class I SAM-dependent methyltransferase [Anaerolineales bacterium]|nr:class I SAM-dependent methyltransferase [Anaerolineales bacterium]
MDSSEYFQIDAVEETHFWYQAMEQLALEMIREAAPKNGLKALDIGCGPGGMTRKLGDLGQVTGLDIHPTAHQISRLKVEQLIMADVCWLPLSKEQFDLVTVFDVLYNQAVVDDRKAMGEIWRILRPGGLLYLREPALESLRGEHDLIVKTRQRYSVKNLRQKLAEAGFDILKISYANMLLAIPIYVKRGFQRRLKHKQAVSDTASLPGALNRLFFLILSTENKLLRKHNLPFGSSVVCLARKPNEP